MNKLLLLSLFFYSPSFGEVIRGADKRGAFTCWYNQGPLLKFCVTYTSERR